MNDFRDQYIQENNPKLQEHQLRLVKDEEYFKFLNNNRINPWSFFFIFLGLLILAFAITYLGINGFFKLNISNSCPVQNISIPETPKCPDIPSCPSCPVCIQQTCPVIPECPSCNVQCGNIISPQNNS